jgi:hypothetical protein
MLMSFLECCEMNDESQNNWRMLHPDEIVEPTDEILAENGQFVGQWIGVSYSRVGKPRCDATIRRRIAKQAPAPEVPASPVDRGTKYHRTIAQTLPDKDNCTEEIAVTVDVYDVLAAFGVTCPAIQHAVKKLLSPGQRGAKDKIKDLQEAAVSIQRAIQMESSRP